MDVEALAKRLEYQLDTYGVVMTVEAREAIAALRDLSARLVAAEQEIAAATEESEDFRAGIAAEMEARVAAEQERDRLKAVLLRVSDYAFGIEDDEAIGGPEGVDRLRADIGAALSRAEAPAQERIPYCDDPARGY